MMNFKTTFLALLLFFQFLAVAQQQYVFTQLAKGTRLDTVITFNSENSAVELPITVIKGQKDGPTFTIVAGIHGYEYPPIIATQALLNEFNPKNIAGTLIILPIANTASFYQRTPFVNPLDGKNLNNAFPGKVDGTLTEQLAYWIAKNVIPVSDVFLDIHGGDANEDLLPFVCFYNNKQTPKQTALAQKLSEVSGFKYVVSYPYDLKPSDASKYAFKEATQKSVTGLSIEAGKLGNVQSDQVLAIKNTVYNMLDYLKIFPSKNRAQTTSKIVRLNNQSYVKVPEKGIYYSNLKSGDRVTKGQSLGYITNEFGKKIAEITAPKAGIILYKIGTPPVNKGETLICLGHTE